MAKEKYRVETEDGSAYEIETEDAPQQQATPVSSQQGTSPQSRGYAQLADSATDYLHGLWSKVSPVAISGSINQALAHPIDAAVGILSQGDLANRAKESFEKGDYRTGIRQSMHAMIPLLGPSLEAASQKIEQGKVAEGLGETTGEALLAVGPKGLRNLRVPVTPRLQNLNPTEAAAIDFAQQRGIPVPAGAATGNPFVQGVQKVAAFTPGGSVVGGLMERGTTRGLQRVAGELANEAHPQRILPERAGAELSEALENRAAGLEAQADVNYGTFRASEANPHNARPVQQGIDPQGNPIVEDVPMPVDLRGIKRQIQPIYNHMTQWMQPALRNSSAGYQAMRSILEGPDHVPASVAEAGLGGLKELSREGTGRNAGLARHIVPELQTAIDTTVGQIDPQALRGLREGRARTAESFTTRGVLDDLRVEPVETFNRVTYRQDAGIDRLRRIAREVPGELPKIGRAYLEKLFEKATAEGGFSKAQGLQGEWRNLGPETKRLMFQNPALIENLDNFFLAAKKIAENPNPSGSALVGLGVGGTVATLTNPATLVGTTLGTAALMRLLYSPMGVRALTRGLTLPLGNRAAAAAAFGNIMRIAGEDVKRKQELQPAQ